VHVRVGECVHVCGCVGGCAGERVSGSECTCVCM
jgi:hypothetical protein